MYEALKEECYLQGIELNISTKTVERVLIKHGLHTPRVKKSLLFCLVVSVVKITDLRTTYFAVHKN